MRRFVFLKLYLYRAVCGTCAVLTVLLCVLALAGCGGSFSAEAECRQQKFQIVCTTFPQYDWVRNLIAGNEGRFELSLLMRNGGDLHNFQPSALDLARISECDLLIYVGGESDAWVEDALREAVNADMRSINMMDMIGARLKEEEPVAEQDSYHGSHNSHNEFHGGRERHDDSALEYDEHVWLSLQNAKLLVEGIAAELEAADRLNAALYRGNSRRYTEELEKLDSDYRAVMASRAESTLLFADRFPFRYLAEDYGLSYFAAFDGCSAETEASFETIAFLSGKLDELGLDTVFLIDDSNKKLAEVIIESTSSKNQRILVLNSMQSVSKKDMESGMTYLSIMRDNLAIFQNETFQD